ncbi:MAG: hypothetical protein K6T83_00150 [Alicyclobacillus sp.]|nr:hypothetical protein [Alicyclobacillus sp.]
MGCKTSEWETKSQQRADEVSRALIRVGVMTHGQITRLLQINPKSEKDLIHHNWDRFEEQLKVPKGIAGGRYIIPGNRVMKLVRLSDDTMKEWAEREGIQRVRNRVRPDMLPQTLNLGEILIRLRHTGLLYKIWDMMFPQGDGEGLHAWLVKYGRDEFQMGMYLLPMRLTDIEDGKKGFIFHGIVRRVVQNSDVVNTLFLVTRKYYTTALRALANIEKPGSHLYLLPLESFMAEPGWYLESIATNERLQRNSLVEEYLDWEDKLVVPVGYDFAALLRSNDDRYRFVDTYVNGSIDRVRSWRRFTLGYQIPNTGHVAGAEVYVYDETMREGLQRLLGTANRDTKDTSIVETQPWPDGLITPDELKEPYSVHREQLIDVDDLPPDEGWWETFNNDPDLIDD